jgi:hypothetical protein
MTAMSEIETHEVHEVVDVVEVDDEAQPRNLAIRHVLDRQITAGQDLGTRLIDAATDASVAVTRAPASVVLEIRGGATLPDALTRSGAALRESVGAAGQQARAAIGEYVGTRAALPNAIVVGAADVAEAVLRNGDISAALDRARQEVATATR